MARPPSPSRLHPNGFTLIELLLVLAIIGTLSAIAIPAILGQRARAKDKSAMHNMMSFASEAVATYDTAKAKGANVSSSLQNLVQDSNSRCRNPWDQNQAAYHYGSPSNTRGLVGLVYSPPTSSTTGIISLSVTLNSPASGSVQSGNYYLLTKQALVE